MLIYSLQHWHMCWLMKFLAHRIKDPSFLFLIRKFLKAGYMEDGLFAMTDEGTPQGGNLSPILSNIFLHYVLDLWFEKRIKRQVSGACYMVRYADDFICMVRNQEDTRYIEQELRKRFAEFGLELHPDKTRTISFGRYERTNAERQGRKANTFDFLVFTHFCDKSRKGNFKLNRKTSRKKFRQKIKAMSNWLSEIRCCEKVKDWWPILKAKLHGHYGYYGVSGNSRSISQFYYVTVILVKKWLNRRSQRKSFNWDSFNEYLKHYPLPKPKLVHNFYTLSPVK